MLSFPSKSITGGSLTGITLMIVVELFPVLPSVSVSWISMSLGVVSGLSLLFLNSMSLRASSKSVALAPPAAVRVITLVPPPEIVIPPGKVEPEGKNNSSSV